ncbi:MAG: FtsX-like permease family protein [Promethearchaeota archaeon]
MHFSIVYFAKTIFRNKRRIIIILLGIIISTGLITGINIACDSLGSKIFEDQFNQIICDFEVYHDKGFDGNFSAVKLDLNPILQEYPQISYIYASDMDFFYNGIINTTGPINTTYYNKYGFTNSTPEPFTIAGLDEFVFLQDKINELIKFEGANNFSIPNGEDPSKYNESTGYPVYISTFMASKFNLSINDNFSIAQFNQEYEFPIYPSSPINKTFVCENLIVKGFFSIKDYSLFSSLFKYSGYFDVDSNTILSTPEIIHEIYMKLWNDSYPEYKWYYENWMIGIVTDHSKYNFFDPNSIEEFFMQIQRDIIYSDLTKQYKVDNRAVEILESVKSTIIIYRVLIFAISIPVILLGGYIGRTNYFIILFGRRREIGLLRCRAVSRKKIISIFSLEAGTLGFLGGIIGIILGFASAGAILTIFPEFEGYSLMELYSKLNIAQISNYLVGIAIGIFISFISAMGPIRKYSKLEIIDALQKYNVKTHTESKLRKIDILLFFISLSAIAFSIWYSPEKLYELSPTLAVIIENIANIMIGLMPIAPFLFIYSLIKLVSASSIKFFTQIISKLVRLLNRKTEFFVTRSILRNRARSARLIFIIAIGISFLILSDTLTESQIIFEEDTQRIYFGVDANFRLYSYSTSNVSSSTIWNYINLLKTNDELNISKITLLSETTYFQLYGENSDLIGYDLEGIIINNYFHCVFLGGDNYTQNMGDLTKFLIGGSPDTIFSKLKTEPNATIVPSLFLQKYHFNIGDDFYVVYKNSSELEEDSDLIQHLSIVGAYTVLPGIRPITSEYADMYFICDRNAYIEIFKDIEIDSYNFLVEYNKTRYSQKDLSRFNRLKYDIVKNINDKVEEAIENYDDNVGIYSMYEYLQSESGYAYSMINFLNIEKIYLLSLVVIGIGVIMYVSIQEKSVDFGILRARGVEKKIIFKTQVSEGFVFLIIAIIISLFSFIASFGLNNAIGNIIFDYIKIPRGFYIPFATLIVDIAIAISSFIGIVYLATYIVSKSSDIKSISDIFRIS